MGIGKPVLVTEGAGIAPFPEGRLRPHRARSGRARLATPSYGSANIDGRGGADHRPTGGRSHRRAPSGGANREAILGPSVRNRWLNSWLAARVGACRGTEAHREVSARAGRRCAMACAFRPMSSCPAVTRARAAILVRTPYGKGADITPESPGLRGARLRHRGAGRARPL